MTFLESEKSKAIRWFRRVADLLESGQAELLPKTLSREDYGDELRLSGTIVPAKNQQKVPSRKTYTEASNPSAPEQESKSNVTMSMFKAKMTPAHAQQCYRVETRDYLCPKCNKFITKSETGLKKHFNRCAN